MPVKEYRFGGGGVGQWWSKRYMEMEEKGDLISTRLVRESLTKSVIREEEWRIFARKVGILLVYFIFFGEIIMIRSGKDIIIIDNTPSFHVSNVRYLFYKIF
jgi:hypothetical protein